MNIPKTLNTKLQTAEPEEIKAILYRKIEEVGPAQTVDYVGFALDNIDSEKSRIDEAIKTLRAVKDSLIAQEAIIREEVNAWMTENGIDKLGGTIVSSISTGKTAAKEEVIIMDDDAVIGAGYAKMTVDKTLVKNAIKGGLDVPGAKIEVTHEQAKIRLNKRRVKGDAE